MVVVLENAVLRDEDDKVEALELDANDYITKSFHLRESLARLRAAIRRRRSLVVATDLLVQDRCRPP
jgi:DNA-binding response OmpR family regulator